MGIQAIQGFIDDYKKHPIHFGYFYLDFDDFDLVVKPCKDTLTIAEMQQWPEEWRMTEQELEAYHKDFAFMRKPENWSEGQWDMVRLWDYIVANQLLTAIRKAQGIEDNLPLFVVNAFDDMDNVDAKGYLKAFRDLDCQVFIIQKHTNYFVRANCDMVIDNLRYPHIV